MFNKALYFKIIFLAYFVLFFTACEKEQEDPLFPSNELIATGSYQGEYWPTEGWRTCKPEDVGMSSGKLKELNDEILLLLKLHLNVNSVLVIKDGYIIAEQYYSEEYNEDSLHRIYSCTKSITSALIGKAIEENYIENDTAKMVDFFPDCEIANLTPDKYNITLKHLLTMSAGLEWYEIEYLYNDERNTFNQWMQSRDRVKFVLDRPMIAAPGDEYSYNTGISHVLSAILQNSTGIRTDSLALEYLFSPLGIDEYYWPIDPNNVAYGGNGLRMKPRDMAKFGYIYLKQGNWDGEQIIPGKWVELSKWKHIARKYIPNYYYGYQWWVSNFDYYAAVGYGGQWIIIVPDHDLVVVFTNTFEDGNSFQRETPERLLNTYIIPAIL